MSIAVVLIGCVNELSTAWGLRPRKRILGYVHDLQCWLLVQRQGISISLGRICDVLIVDLLVPLCGQQIGA